MRGDARLREGDGIDSHSANEQCGLALHQHQDSSTNNADNHEVGSRHKNQFHARDDNDLNVGCKPERGVNQGLRIRPVLTEWAEVVDCGKLAWVNFVRSLGAQCEILALKPSTTDTDVTR